jgi:hypothetical protein
LECSGDQSRAVDTVLTMTRDLRTTPTHAEALGYVGAAAAILACGFAFRAGWPELPPSTQLGLVAGAATVLGGSGALLGTSEVPAFARLRDVLWLLSTAAAAVLVATWAVRTLYLDGLGAALLAATAATGYATELWRHLRTATQLASLFVASATLVGTGLAALEVEPRAWVWGTGIGMYAGLWALTVYRGYLGPPAVGYLLAGTGVLVGTFAAVL